MHTSSLVLKDSCCVDVVANSAKNVMWYKYESKDTEYCTVLP